MSDFGSDSGEKAAPTSAPTSAGSGGGGGGGSGGASMHDKRMDVTRHRRAVKRKSEGGNGAGPQVDIPEGGGSSLSGGVKKSMEKKLGADLSSVKIHTGGASEDASSKLSARAFTVGNDVHFNSGEFNPGSKEGTKLLAHELTHVVQGQKGGVQKKEEEGEGGKAEGKDGEQLAVSDPDEPAEKEADDVAEKATADVGDKGVAGGDEKKEAGGAKAEGGGEEKKEEKKEEEGAEAETTEAAPEAGAKLQAPISAKYSASALRKVLRKTAYREPEEEKPAEAEAPAAEAEGGGEEKKEAGGEANAEGGAEAKAEGGEEKKDAGGEAKKEAGGEANAGGEEKKEAGGEGEQAEAQGEEKKEESVSVAAKLKGVHRKIFRAGRPDPAADAFKAKVDADIAKVGSNPATLDAFNAMVASLDTIVKPASKASTALRIGKLKDAAARTRPKLSQFYGAQADVHIKSFIDDRIPIADKTPGDKKFAENAKAAGAALKQKGSLDPSLQVDAAWHLVNYGNAGPEEEMDAGTLDESGGIMKCFDVGNFMRDAMSADMKAKWKTACGDNATAQFVAAAKSTGKPPLAPPGKENDPAFKGKNFDQIYTGQLNGFVGQAKDMAAVQGLDFHGILNYFKLQPSYYPSNSMFVINAGKSQCEDAQKNKGAKIGKPSMFSLLNFDENVYDETDRKYGHLGADNDPTKPGNALELACTGFPQEIWSSATLK